MYRLKIKEIRESKNLSLDKLSKLTGIPKTTIYNIEHNNVKATFENVLKIAEALNVTVYDFLTE
jgi:transcriptional regulator with XRE-family HTH domain